MAKRMNQSHATINCQKAEQCASLNTEMCQIIDNTKSFNAKKI